ncbi:hypothetical protein OHS70_28715 [Streptomyces sp. NBC_00390]|uniref:hypothetical protein n=1 Tax=Streptomyces sp. NBC_00390 TaxID=2975736 RepID=UPI002E1C1736
MAHGNTPYPGTPAYGGWMPPVPPPPKPGVIPLAPLALGAILGGAFSTIGRHWKQLLGVALAAYGVAAVLVCGAIGIAYVSVSDRLHRVLDWSGSEAPGWDEFGPLVLSFGAVYLFGLLTLLVANAVIYASCPVILQDAVLGRPTTIGSVWRRALPRTGAVLGSVVLTSLIAFVPILLTGMAFFGFLFAMIMLTVNGTDGFGWVILVGFLGALITGPAAVWLWVRFSLAPAAAVFEGQGVIASMSRSAQLVRGAWWRIFGISLLAYLIAVVAGYVIQLPLSVLNALPAGPLSLSDDASSGGVAVTILATTLVFGLISSLISQALTVAFPQLVLNLLYIDRRIRTENLAAALAEAAGPTS